MERFDGVAIAGAGPVGLTAAVSLASKGIPVRVLEKGPGLSSESRASTFHPSSLEILEELGVVKGLLDNGLTVRSFSYRDRKEGLIAEFDYSVLIDDTPYPYRVQFEQSKLTPLLLEKLAEYENSEVWFEAGVISVDPTDDDVGVAIRSHQDEQSFRASYLVGADGAASAVRKTAGIDFTGLTYPERYLVVSTTFNFADAIRDIALVNYISDPEEWFALLATPDHWRLTFPLKDDEDDLHAQGAGALQERVQKVHRIEGDYPIVHTNIYRVHRRIAETFSKGRLALAGDAAHVNNPLGGMGMNSGILDAYFLADDLEVAYRDGTGSTALAEYARRHQHIATEVVGKQSNLNWVALREPDPKKRAQQQQELREFAADEERCREYLRGASLLTALDELRSPGRVAG